jgi:hypothetical protein
LFGVKQAIYCEKGLSGDQEVLAFIYSDGPYSGFWYGQICRLSTQDIKFCAVIAWLSKFVNAHTPELLLERFHYTTLQLLEHEPCTIQNHDDALRISDTFEKAVIDLAEMIKLFDIKKRWPSEDSEYYNNPININILCLYGINSPNMHRLICPHVVWPEER